MRVHTQLSPGRGLLAARLLAVCLAALACLAAPAGAAAGGRHGGAALHAGLAAPPARQAEDPVGSIGSRLEATAKSISRVATPIAIFCIVLVLVMYLFAPVLPEVAMQNKGYVMRALVIVALISLVPELVRFVSGLTGG